MINIWYLGNLINYVIHFLYLTIHILRHRKKLLLLPLKCLSLQLNILTCDISCDAINDCGKNNINKWDTEETYGQYLQQQ